MTMNIALFTDTYTPDVNGVAKTLARWVNYLTENGHNVRVFAPEPKEVSQTHSETHVERYKSLPFFLYPELQAALPNPLDIKQRLLDFNPDIVHVATPFNIGVLGRHYALKYDLPFVASYHTNFDQYLSSYKMEWAEKLLNSYLAWFHKDCEKVYAPSNDTAKTLIAQHYPNVELWKRGVEADLFRPIDEHTLSRKDILFRYDVPPDKFTLLYVGRLSTEKSLDVLLETAKQLPTSLKEQAQVLLVGDGPMRKEIEEKIPSINLPIHLLGFRSGEELAQIYAVSDVFFFPSATETFGNVVLEAMASGLPVIGANAGGVKELITSGQNGLLCSPGQISTFVESVECFYNYEFLRIAHGENARNYALSQSWDHIFSQLLDSYESVIGKTIFSV